MKVVSLNIWGGHEFDALMSFIRNSAPDTDIFCFQEAYTFPDVRVSRGSRLNIFEELCAALEDYHPLFEPIQDNIDEDGMIDAHATFGQAIFLKKHLLPIQKNGFVFTYLERNAMRGDDFATLGGGFQYVQVTQGEKPLTILSVHGIAQPGDKLDTPVRLAQAEGMKKFISGLEGQVVVCGDFNLAPETQSVTMLERGLKNLVKEFHIQTTRGKLHAAKYPNDPSPQRFSDYMFVSPEMQVDSFEVPDIPISDHLPLILNFS